MVSPTASRLSSHYNNTSVHLLLWHSSKDWPWWPVAGVAPGALDSKVDAQEWVVSIQYCWRCWVQPGKIGKRCRIVVDKKGRRRCRIVVVVGRSIVGTVGAGSHFGSVRSKSFVGKRRRSGHALIRLRVCLKGVDGLDVRE